MPQTETHLAITHLEDLRGHAGWKLFVERMGEVLERKREHLEKEADAGGVARLQGEIKALRFALQYREQMVEQLRLKAEKEERG